MSGRRKCKRDHNSGKLFCNGVPDNSSLFAVGIYLRVRVRVRVRV